MGEQRNAIENFYNLLLTVFRHMPWFPSLSLEPHTNSTLYPCYNNFERFSLTYVSYFGATGAPVLEL